MDNLTRKLKECREAEKKNALTNLFNHITEHLGSNEERIIFEGYLSLQYKNIYRLPDNLTVTGDLILTLSDILELPKGLRVGGDLKIGGTLIKHLPPDLEVTGRVKWKKQWYETVKDAKEDKPIKPDI